MMLEISLIAIGTAIVVSKILHRIKVTDADTQTEQGLWLPQLPIYFDDSSDSEARVTEMELIHTDSEESILEMELIKEYVSAVSTYDD